MGFKAEDYVEPLDYDFSAFGGPTGTTPEPSSDQLDAFIAAFRESMKRSGVEVKEGGKISLAAAFEKVDGSDQEKMLADLYTTIADFTSNKPSADELRALPYRVQKAYLGWLIGRFFNPESQTADGKA